MSDKVARIIERLETQYRTVTARLIQLVVEEELGVVLTLQQALQEYVKYREARHE